MKINELPFDWEIENHDVSHDLHEIEGGKRDGARTAAIREIGQKRMNDDDELSQGFIDSYMNDPSYLSSDPMDDVSEWDDFEIDFMD